MSINEKFKEVEMSSMKYILRECEVCEAVGLSRATIRRMMAKNEFPKSMKISTNSVGWCAQEIGEWVQKLRESR